MTKDKKNKTRNFKNELENILNDHHLSYSDLNFEKSNGDVLQSYHELNKKINEQPNYFRNIRNIFSSFNFNLILKPLYTIALTAIVIIAIIELKETSGIEYTEVTVDQGEKIQLYVTDEIKIWVNSESTIKIPLQLKRNHTIYLNGEAYFEINKKRGKRIKIISEGMEFKTSHASFNIHSDNSSLIANVKEGKIQLYNPKLPRSTTLELSTKDKVLYKPALKFIAVEKENSMNYLAWHTGKLEFNHTPMYNVVGTISEIYEIPVVITNKKISNSDFNAQFENASIDDILNKIQSTFNCEISADGSKIIIN